MNQIDNIMALADEYAEAAVQWSRKVESDPTSRAAIVGTDAHCQALRAAIEAALTPGEPVAWMDKYGVLYQELSDVLPTDIPLYTAPQPQRESKPLFADLIAQHSGLAEELAALDAPQPQQWVGLTDEELDGIYAANGGTRTRRQIAAAIEAKLREKNGGGV